MDVDQLEKWVMETDEGKIWLNGQKVPLLAKRDELLSEVKTANGRITELEQRLSQAESNLSESDAFIARNVVDGELEQLLKGAGVFDALTPIVKKAVQDTYGVQIKRANGDFTAYGTIKGADGTDTEAGLEDIVKDWAKQSASGQFIMARNNGGGATGDNRSGSGTPPPSLQGYNGRQLASMSDADFANARNSELRRQH